MHRTLIKELQINVGKFRNFINTARIILWDILCEEVC